MSRAKSINNKQRWVVGVHACAEALRASHKFVTGVFFDNEETAQSKDWVTLLKPISVKPQIRKKSFFTQLSQFGHQGVAVSLSNTPQWPERMSSLLLFLDQVGDPHNLGAVMRTGWLVGAQGVAITEHSSVKLTPTAAKVASGGAEHIPLQRCHFVNELKSLREEGYWIYGFDHQGESSLYDVELPEKAIFVFGNEEKGLRSSVAGVCDQLLNIPQVDAQASYNISVSVAMACGEYQRQTRGRKK